MASNEKSDMILEAYPDQRMPDVLYDLGNKSFLYFIFGLSEEFQKNFAHFLCLENVCISHKLFCFAIIVDSSDIQMKKSSELSKNIGSALILDGFYFSNFLSMC